MEGNIYFHIPESAPLLPKGTPGPPSRLVHMPQHSGTAPTSSRDLPTFFAPLSNPEGSLCWLNTVIQLFRNCPPLRERLIHLSPHHPEKPLCKLFGSLLSGMGDSVRVEGGRSLSELRDHLRKAKLLQEDTNGMADPNEVVLTLIEQFSKEDTYIKELFNTEVCDISHCRSGGCYTKKNYNSSELSGLHPARTDFYHLQVAVPESKKPPKNMMELLHEWVAPDTRSGHCGHPDCTNTQSNDSEGPCKGTYVHRLPPILSVRVNRFHHFNSTGATSSSTQNTAFRLSTSNDMRSLTAHGDGHQQEHREVAEDYLYEPFAFFEYTPPQQQRSRPHYWLRAKRGKNWYNLNDSQCTKVKERNINQSGKKEQVFSDHCTMVWLRVKSPHFWTRQANALGVHNDLAHWDRDWPREGYVESVEDTKHTSVICCC